MRKDGNTAFLLDMLLQGVSGTVTADKTSGIAVCVNCGGCRGGVCAVTDGMQAVYQAAETAERVVVASPVYFGNVTGLISDVMSRFQRYFQDGYGKLPRVGAKKEGVAILTAGGSGDIAAAEKSMRLLFKMLNVQNFEWVTSYQTDKLSAKDDQTAVSKILDVRKRWFGV